MRISLITGGFGPGGGTAGQAWMLARGLSLRGHDVEVWAREAPTDGGGARITIRPLPRARRALWAASASPSLGRLVHAFERAPGAEIVRASGGVHRAWLLASRTTLMRTMQTRLPTQRHEARLDAQTVRRARIVVCNSVRVAGEVCGWHRVSPQRVRVVRNGVDLERFAPDDQRRARARRRWRAPGRVALFLADGWFRKNLWAAALAFRRAAGPDDRLVVFGRGAAGIEARVRGLLGSAVRFEGRERAPEQWLPGADVVLSPTRYDASANVVLEALAAGVPVVTTGRDGAAEIVPDPALVVPDPEDVAGLCRALTYAWAEGPALRQRCRDAATAWPGSRMVLDMERIYMETVHG